MIIRDIFKVLNEWAPVSLAAEYDNVGLLVGDYECTVSACIISLDCTDLAVRAAIENGANLIITHHPIIFEPLRTVHSDSIIYKIIKNNISVISMHTNLDSAIGGVNDCLCNTLELRDVTGILPVSNGFKARIGLTKQLFTPTDFAQFIKQKLGGNVRYTSNGNAINRVCVCSGSGGSLLNYISELPAIDAFVTADVKHSSFIQAAHIGLNIFDAGHFETEDIIVDPISKKLTEIFADIDFIAHHDNVIKQC